MDAQSFLETVAGVTRAQTDGSADRPLLIGTVDPAYVSSSFPGTMPKVTFDGESVLSGKTYVVLSPAYRPSPGDRVVLMPVGTTYAIVGSVTPGAGAYIGGALAVASNLTVAGSGTVGTSLAIGTGFTIGGFQGGYVEYGTVTAGNVAASTTVEVAIPTASWVHEPSLTFKTGRLYVASVSHGFGLGAGSAHAALVRLRKGAQTISGQVLGSATWQDTQSTSFNSKFFRAYIKNVSGADITTALSLTIARTTGASDVRLYGDGSSVPLIVEIQDAGLESGHKLSPIAISIT